MVLPNEERQRAVVYTSGVCNLNCRYCNIDKNPALKDIDKMLEKSFEGDYYFNRIKEYFPRKDSLRCLETWGGEPFLHMDRVYPLVRKLIEYYPYFDEMMSSTNFAYDEWLDQFLGLMNCFGEYPYRQFKFTLQLSVDGPQYINDANRGQGVTERCVKNFDKLLDAIVEGKVPQNVCIECYLKGTLDLDAVRKLDTKEKIIQFYQFCEEAYENKIIELNNPQIYVYINIPNMAGPAPTTVEDGRIFANFIRMCREVERENMMFGYFKLHDQITPFGKNVFNSDVTYYQENRATCGSGGCLVGFLPDNLMSACHEGFTLIVDEYKKYQRDRSDDNLTIELNNCAKDIPVPICLTDEQYALHEENTHLCDRTTARLATDVAEIIALAMAGQIEHCYIDETNALCAAVYIYSMHAYCMKNNYTITGSFTIQPTDIFKLVLNGALQYLTEGGVWYNGQLHTIDFSR